jgi:hypothetical protein
MKKAKRTLKKLDSKKLRVEVIVSKTDQLTVEATVDGLVELTDWLNELGMEEDIEVTTITLTN